MKNNYTKYPLVTVPHIEWVQTDNTGGVEDKSGANIKGNRFKGCRWQFR